MKTEDYYLQMADRIFIIESSFNEYILEVEKESDISSGIKTKHKIQEISKSLGELYQMFGNKM